MRKHIVLTIFKKEVLDIVRDKKTLFMSVVLPIILYPVLMFLMTALMSMSSQQMAQRTLKVAFETPPEAALVEKINSRTEKQGKLKICELEGESYKEALEKETIDVYVKEEPKGKTTSYEVYYNSSIQNSSEACSRMKEALDEYKEEMISQRIKDAGLNEKDILEPVTYTANNTAENEQMAGYMLGIILPFLLVLGILTGSIYPAIDVMAGEKERGTLETLLTLPISNMELVMGKYLAVALSALVSAMLSILSMAFSLVFLLLNAQELVDTEQLQLNFGKLVLPLLITLVCIALFTMVIAAASMCVCSLARSFKEAQNALTPLILVAMVLSYASMIPTIELNQVTAGIPVVNVVLLIKSVLTFKYDLSLLTIVLISNCIFVMAAIWLLSRLFKSEEILFGSSMSFSFLEKRSDIKKGTLPKFSDGIIIFSLVMVLMIYVCSYFQVKFGIWGVAATELLIFAVPVILSIYIKTDFKKVYALQSPSFTGILGTVFLFGGLWLLNLIIQMVFQHLGISENEQATKAQYDLITGGSGIVAFVVVAVMPAICEETLFRGFIFTAMKEEKHVWRAILLSSLLFGLAHMDLIKMLPITVLGLGMGYILYKTGTIYCTALFHLLNNGIAVLLTRYGSEKVEKAEQLFLSGNLKESLIMIAVCVVCMGIGCILLAWTGKKEKSGRSLAK